MKASGRVCSLSNLSLFCRMDMLEADTCYFFFRNRCRNLVRTQVEEIINFPFPQYAVFIMPILITMHLNGFKAYILHITGHHKHESILYCHTSVFVLAYTYVQKLFTILTLLFPPLRPTYHYHESSFFINGIRKTARHTVCKTTFFSLPPREA